MQAVDLWYLFHFSVLKKSILFSTGNSEFKKYDASFFFRNELRHEVVMTAVSFLFLARHHPSIWKLDFDYPVLKARIWPGPVKDSSFRVLATPGLTSFSNDENHNLKVGSYDPIFSSNYSSAHFLRQQLDV